MSSIMELIGPELSELSALEYENLPYLTLFTLQSSVIRPVLAHALKTRAPLHYLTTRLTFCGDPIVYNCSYCIYSFSPHHL